MPEPQPLRAWVVLLAGGEQTDVVFSTFANVKNAIARERASALITEFPLDTGAWDAAVTSGGSVVLGDHTLSCVPRGLPGSYAEMAEHAQQSKAIDLADPDLCCFALTRAHHACVAPWPPPRRRTAVRAHTARREGRSLV